MFSYVCILWFFLNFNTFIYIWLLSFTLTCVVVGFFVFSWLIRWLETSKRAEWLCQCVYIDVSTAWMLCDTHSNTNKWDFSVWAMKKKRSNKNKATIEQFQYKCLRQIHVIYQMEPCVYWWIVSMCVFSLGYHLIHWVLQSTSFAWNIDYIVFLSVLFRLDFN